MADDPIANSLAPGVRNRSTAEGDVPETLRRRYYVDGRGGAGLGFYADATVKAPAFRDAGRQLVAARNDPNAIRDMTAIARHRGWTIVVAKGEAGFRREAWLSGRAVGLEVRGYRPTERDIQELDRRIDRRLAREARSGRAGAGNDERTRTPDPEGDRGARSRLRAVETVVRARVAERSSQERIIAQARGRIANWLERGARFAPMPMTRSSTRDDHRTHRERQR
nr:LPD7 domain-containing protein [Brevundimonas diminuta]